MEKLETAQDGKASCLDAYHRRLVTESTRIKNKHKQVNNVQHFIFQKTLAL